MRHATRKVDWSSRNTGVSPMRSAGRLATSAAAANVLGNSPHRISAVQKRRLDMLYLLTESDCRHKILPNGNTSALHL
jgi:hypothetical protein